MDNINLNLPVLIDLSAALDTVNHLKLFKNTKYKFNINGISLD